MSPSSYIFCILMMSYRVLYGRKIAGVLNINQVDFSMQRSYFEHNFDDDLVTLKAKMRGVSGETHPNLVMATLLLPTFGGKFITICLVMLFTIMIIDQVPDQ